MNFAFFDHPSPCDKESPSCNFDGISIETNIKKNIRITILNRQTPKSDKSRRKRALHDHLSPGKQRVADELARPQGNGSVGHGCRFLWLTARNLSTSDEGKRESCWRPRGLSKFAVDFRSQPDCDRTNIRCALLWARLGHLLTALG